MLQIHVTQDLGDILVFLTGQDEIEKSEEILRQKIEDLGDQIMPLRILTLYSNLSQEKQLLIFK